jgi:hypothetical protein
VLAVLVQRLGALIHVSSGDDIRVGAAMHVRTFVRAGDGAALWKFCGNFFFKKISRNFPLILCWDFDFWEVGLAVRMISFFQLYLDVE